MPLKNLLAILTICALLSSCSKTTGTPGNDNTGSNTGGGNTGGNNTGGSAEKPTVTAPETQFISFQDYTVSGFGGYKLEAFSLSASTNLVLRFASTYKSQAAIIPASQLSNFKTMAGFSGYAIFDNQVGTKTVTLGAGDYYAGVRNTANSANNYSMELDYAITLPASDKCKFNDNYFQDTKSFANGGKITQEFTVQSGYRYFLDGDNVGFKTYIIPASEVGAFNSGQSFQYYVDYKDESGAGPGLYEVKLPAGTYYFAATGTGACSITYTMERWKVN